MTANDPYEIVENKETAKELLSQLSPREKVILFGYCVLGFPQRELGEMIGVSEARISQILTESREVIDREEAA